MLNCRITSEVTALWLRILDRNVKDTVKTMDKTAQLLLSVFTLSFLCHGSENNKVNFKITENKQHMLQLGESKTKSPI